MAFKKLVRFQDGGKISNGDLVSVGATGFVVQKLLGSLDEGFRPTEETITVDKLLCPIERTPIIICVGLNYQKHAKESGLDVPKYPVIFTKPSDALAGPSDSIPVHTNAQTMLDYEGELVVIIGRDAKNVSKEDALDYVLGYAIGNDVSARNFQTPDVSGGQYCFAKSFDKFAPIGPAIFSKEVIPDPQKLKYTLKVNGEVRQETATDDMIWSVRQIIEHLSMGTTLRKGTVIMTGTPSGVGFFMKKFLEDGDVVEVEMEGLGSIHNKMVFE